MKQYNTSAEVRAIFEKAYFILTTSVIRANYLRDQAKKIKHSKNVHTWINRMNKKDELLRIADFTENRGRKIFGSIVDFQGKVVNWRHNTSDGQPIFDIQLSITNISTNELNRAKELAY